MLVIICCIMLTISGGAFSGRDPPRCGSTDPSCPKHEHYTENDPTCLRTCANRHVPKAEDCKPFTGCVCDDDRVRLYDNATGPCIPEKKCPKKCKDPKAVYIKCPNPCPLTCAEPDPRPCSKMCLEYGCECASGYILSKIGGKCIRPKNCPARCPKNENYVENDEACLKTCGNRLLPGDDTAGVCQPFTGCVCNDGYVRKYDNATGPCIPVKSCPPIPKCDDVNEVPTSCRIICPPQTCDSIFTKYNCVPSDCEPGCDCRNNYLRNSEGVCILSDDCFKESLPECGPNEIATNCAIVCPPQSCESIYTTYMCANLDCTAGCNCIDGYLRNSSGVCIPSEDCFKGNGCNGDLNATHVECGNGYPATCAEPDPGKALYDIYVLNGCQCNTGYILSEPNGVCIALGDCPGEAPICGANQTYVDCKVGCPTNYCPADDSRAIVACSAPYPCPGGCACQSGYLLVSRDDERCILASDCPPVECTRPNEVWEPNPSNCFLERCEDRGIICDYPYPAQPRCVCKQGYYRNESDICIPESECPDIGCNGDPNAMPEDCPSSCPPTCANPNTDEAVACIQACLPGGCVCKPGFILTKIGGRCVRPEECPGELGCKGDRNATFTDCTSACPLTCANQDENRPCLAICLPSGCECNPGYVLTEKGGKCIKPEDCPAEPQCNGDRNATFKECPSACQATCAEPDTDGFCTDVCTPSSCVCKQGYLLTETGGKCIKPGDCPGGSPKCKVNETYVYCKVGCPTNYCPVDDSLAEVACDPFYPCPGGCACKGGYLILSYEDDRCILASECPPVKCTRPNEVWDPKPSNCLRERCDNRNIPCDFPFPIPPRCVCEEGYFRNENDTCVPESQCQQECTEPNEEWDPSSSKCVCKEGYDRDQDGACVPEDGRE